jgi:hypothetical protein
MNNKKLGKDIVVGDTVKRAKGGNVTIKSISNFSNVDGNRLDLRIGLGTNGLPIPLRGDELYELDLTKRP